MPFRPVRSPPKTGHPCPESDASRASRRGSCRFAAGRAPTASRGTNSRPQKRGACGPGSGRESLGLLPTKTRASMPGRISARPRPARLGLAVNARLGLAAGSHRSPLLNAHIRVSNHTHPVASVQHRWTMAQRIETRGRPDLLGPPFLLRCPLVVTRLYPAEKKKKIVFRWKTILLRFALGVLQRLLHAWFTKPPDKGKRP